jgi:hypothetical protein
MFHPFLFPPAWAVGIKNKIAFPASSAGFEDIRDSGFELQSRALSPSGSSWTRKQKTFTRTRCMDSGSSLVSQLTSFQNPAGPVGNGGIAAGIFFCRRGDLRVDILST